jgi:hypothetical protein
VSVTTRRERREKEKRKKRRQGHGGGSAPDRTGTFITLAIVVIVLVGGVLLLRQVGAFDPPVASIDPNIGQVGPNEVVGTKYPNEGNGHVADGTKVTYGQTPPTSGAHYANPATWGIKDTQLPDETTVHNLEHGGIVITYNQLTPDDLSKLKTLVRQLTGGQYRKMILEPYDKLTDAKIAVSAWTWQLKLNSFDESQIAKFVRSHYQGPDAPEPNAN